MKITNLIWLYWMHHVLQLEQLENILKYFLNQNGPDMVFKPASKKLITKIIKIN